MTYKKILFASLLTGTGTIAMAQKSEAPANDSTKTVAPTSVWFPNKPTELRNIHMNFLLRSSLEIPGGDEQSAIRMNEARFEVLGSITPDLDFRVRYRLNRNQAPRSQDNSPGAIDHASINYKFGKEKKWSVNVGKQAAYIGSWEFETNPTYEYQYSEFVNYQTNIFLMAIRLGYKLNDNHSVYLQLHNTYNDNFKTHVANTGYAASGLKGAKAPLGVYASWLGKLFDNKLHTFWSYNVSEFAKGEVNHSVALGNKFLLGKLTGYLDLQSATLPVDYVNIASPSMNKYAMLQNPGGQPDFGRNVNYKSAILRLDYQFVPGWFITAKGFYETASQLKDNNFAGRNFRQNIGYLGGLEYQPIASQNFKIFGYYYNNEQRYRNSIATANGNQQHHLFSVGFLYFVNAF